MKKTMKRALALLIALLLALPNFAMAELAEALVSSAPVETEYGEAEQSLGNDADDAAAPADSDADVPDEVTEDMPTDGASDVPADGSADAPADGASDAPADGSGDAPADGAAGVSAPQAADAPAEGSDEGQPADDTNPLDATPETPTSGEETGDGVVSADAPDAVEAEPGEGEELTLGDDEPETPEDAPEAAQTVRVLFDVFPGDAVVTVRAAQDDFVYAAMEDGAYLLPPGEYIYTAAAENKDTPYGDPWQLINVFDNDPDTKVVCEGYSKAFKFLFDLSGFNSSYDCLLVTGQMTGATGAGPHMWNVVRMEDEANYLVDVTNCDEGTVGAPDKLFMAYGPTLGNDGSMTFAAGENNITYAYDEDTQNTFDNWQLTIVTAPYTTRKRLRSSGRTSIPIPSRCPRATSPSKQTTPSTATTISPSSWTRAWVPPMPGPTTRNAIPSLTISQYDKLEFVHHSFFKKS